MQTEIARRVGISTYQVRTWRHRREERLSIDAKGPIKVSLILMPPMCSIDGKLESTMANNCMQKFNHSGFLEAFVSCTTSCRRCVKTVDHSLHSCPPRLRNSSRPAMQSGSSFAHEMCNEISSSKGERNRGAALALSKSRGKRSQLIFLNTEKQPS